MYMCMSFVHRHYYDGPYQNFCTHKFIHQNPAKDVQDRYLRYLGVLDACSGGQSWQTMLSIGIFFAWEGYISPCLFYPEYHVDYKSSKISKIRACLVPLI